MSGRRSVVPSLGGRGEGWVAAQAALGALVVLFGFLGSGWPSSIARAFTVAGIAVAASGIGLLLAGVRSLGASLTPLPKPKDDAAMREGGVYRIVRHPIYGGMILAAVGWSMARTPLAAVPTALLALVLELKSRVEESWLTERYPSYAAYRQRVRWRFVPGLR